MKQDIESLRSFAVANNELPFAHLCAAALNGEEWAIARLEYFTQSDCVIVDTTSAINTTHLLNLIKFTDTTRPVMSKNSIESLRSFADTRVRIGDMSADNEHMVAFVHMCTAALNGEQWAVERMTDPVRGVLRHADYAYSTDATVLREILATDCTRP